MYCHSPCYQRSRGSVPRFEQGEFRNTPQTDLRSVCVYACGSVSAPVTHSDTATARMYCHSPCYQRSRGSVPRFEQGEFRNTLQKNPAGCLRLRLRLLPRKVSSLRVAPLRYFTGTPFTVSAPVTHLLRCGTLRGPRLRFPLPSRTPTQRLRECIVILRATNGREGASRAFTRSISGRCIFLHRGERYSFFVRRGAYILYNVFTLRAAGSKIIDEIHRRALARKGKK